MSDLDSEALLPLPDEFSRHYWEAAKQDRLLIQHCKTCDQSQFYPRPFCMHCFTPDPQWVEAKGTGKLHTYSIVRRTSDPRFINKLPYVQAVVELDEGVRMTANIIDSDLESLCCDMPVHLVFEDIGGGFKLPQFTVDKG